MGIEDPIPGCVKRLMIDSRQRAEQKFRDEKFKEERERHEDERILYESKMLQKQRRQQHGTRKFEKFMDDQIIFQVRR